MDYRQIFICIFNILLLYLHIEKFKIINPLKPTIMTYYSDQKLKSEQEETFKRILIENPNMGEDLKGLLKEALLYNKFGIITVSKRVLNYLFEKYNMTWLDEATGEASFIYDDCEGLIGIITGSEDYEWCRLVLSTGHDGSVETALWEQLTKYPYSVMSKMGLISLFENGDFTPQAIALTSVIIWG